MGRLATERDKMMMRRLAERNPYHNWANGVKQQHRKKGIDVRITHQELEDLAKGVKQCEYCETYCVNSQEGDGEGFST